MKFPQVALTTGLIASFILLYKLLPIITAGFLILYSAISIGEYIAGEKL